jgi:hypothetical protein
MSAWQPKKGTREIDRVIPTIGRVRIRTGTHDKRLADNYDRMLDAIPLDVVRLLADKLITLREIYDLWTRGRTLPSADELRPLLKTLDAWLEQPLKAVGPSEETNRAAFVERIRAIAPAGAGMRAFPGLCKQLYLDFDADGRAAMWNRSRAAGLAFLRDVVGRRTELYRQLAEIPMLREIPKFSRHPCTVAEARAVAAALGPKWGGIWWAMCCTGMGAKEYWKDGWRVVGHGIEIAGQKRTARNRVVPLVVTPPAPIGTMAGFAEALDRLELGVTARDARRSYERWLDELGAPDYLQDAFMGHGPKTMRALYKWGDITAWLAEWRAKLCGYVGEQLLSLESGGAT